MAYCQVHPKSKDFWKNIPKIKIRQDIIPFGYCYPQEFVYLNSKEPEYTAIYNEKGDILYKTHTSRTFSQK